MAQLIVDADGHILEPKDLWQTYLEPKYRDRALRIETDDKGFEHWVVNGKPYDYRYGVFGDMGAIGKKLERYFTPGQVTYDEGRALSPGGGDPHERVKLLDAEGVDKVLLYPSLGITWEGGCDDAELAQAYCRAYNNWLLEFCSHYPDRLYAIAHISLMDPESGAKELERSVKAGAKGAMLRAYPSGDRPYGHPDNDIFWATAQDLGVPVGLHIGGNGRLAGHELFDITFGAGTWWIYNMFAVDVQIGLMSLMHGGVFQRYPGLTIALLESGCGWVGYWLDRMDETYHHMGFSTPLDERPSEYFKRQCIITMDPDESLGPDTVRRVGAQCFMWDSDYPHSDGHMNAVAEIREAVAELPQADQRMILGDNAAKAYHLV